MKTFKTDVLIVGGGPAGASAALSILKYSDFSVTIIESSNLQKQRVGEQVSKSIFDFIDYLGLTKEDFGNDCFLPGYSSNAAWGTNTIASRNSIQSTSIDSYQLDRELFDLVLLNKAVENGTELLLESKCLKFYKNSDFWTIEVSHPEFGLLTIESKYLIDASGRQSQISRLVGAHLSKEDELVAIGAFLEFKDERTLEQEIVLETVENGWWYYAVLPNKKVVATLFSDAEIVKSNKLNTIENWSEELNKTIHIKHKVSGAIAYEKPWVRNAFSHITDFSSIDNFIAIGDAAVSFDPISSMGIGFAISSACNGALAIMNGGQENIKIYQNDLNNIYQNYLSTKSQYYYQERRWLESSFWKTRLNKSLKE